MATKNPRLNVVLEPPVYYSVKKLAKKNGISLSLEARDLIKEALELVEDRYWAEKAEEREKTLNRKKALTHARVSKMPGASLAKTLSKESALVSGESMNVLREFERFEDKLP